MSLLSIVHLHALFAFSLQGQMGGRLTPVTWAGTSPPDVPGDIILPYIYLWHVTWRGHSLLLFPNTPSQ